MIGARIIESVLNIKDREMYDQLSKVFIKANIFSTLVNLIIYSIPMKGEKLGIERMEYRAISRILELCACH